MHCRSEISTEDETLASSYGSLMLVFVQINLVDCRGCGDWSLDDLITEVRDVVPA